MSKDTKPDWTVEHDRQTTEDLAAEIVGELSWMLGDRDGPVRPRVVAALVGLIVKLREQVSVSAFIDDQLQLHTEASFDDGDYGETNLARHTMPLQALVEEYFGDWETEDLPKLADELRRLAYVVETEIASRAEAGR
jgi:hypothetical protein